MFTESDRRLSKELLRKPQSETLRACRDSSQDFPLTTLLTQRDLEGLVSGDLSGKKRAFSLVGSFPCRAPRWSLRGLNCFWGRERTPRKSAKTGVRRGLSRSLGSPMACHGQGPPSCWQLLPLCVCVCAKSFQLFQLLAILWTVAHQVPLSMGFSRQEYWSGWSCSPPGDLPDPRIEPTSLRSPALAGGFFTTSTTWEALPPSYLLPIWIFHPQDPCRTKLSQLRTVGPSHSLGLDPWGRGLQFLDIEAGGCSEIIWKLLGPFNKAVMKQGFQPDVFVCPGVYDIVGNDFWVFIHERCWGEWLFPHWCVRGWVGLKIKKKKKQRFFLLFGYLVVIQQLFLDIGLCSGIKPGARVDTADQHIPYEPC